MAVNATFKADFSSFLKAIDQAEIALVDFGKGASTVEKQLNRMVDNFSGRKLIQEASLLTIAVEKAGGVAKLTAREFELVGAKANEAAEKMHKLGYEVPAGLQNLADATKKAETATGGLATSTGTLTDQTKAFDNVLQQTGVSIGPFTKAFDEIAATAGKSVGEIGKLSTAGLAMGAAYAGWQLGRMIADFFKLDEKIGKATASLLGWGDVSKEVAGAQQDTINAAIQHGADATISYTEAIKFNTEWHKKRLAVVKEANEADIKTKEAMVELNSVGASTQKTLEGLNGAVVEAIKYYLAAGVSQSNLATAYGLTASQVKAVATSVADEAEVTKKAAADKIAAEKSLADFRESAHNRQLEILKIQKAETAAGTARVNQAVVDELNARIKLNAAYGLDAEGHVKMTSALETYNTKLAELHKNKQEGIDQYAQEQVLMDEYTTALYDEAVANDKAAEAERKAKEAKDKSTESTDKATKAAGVYMNQLHMLVSDPKLAAFFGGNVVANSLYSAGSGGFTPEEAAAMAAGQFINFAASAMATGWKGFGTRAAGGPVSAGTPYMVGERGPELFVPGQSGRIAAGGGTTINIHVTQPLGTPDAIARAVGEAFTTRSRAIGARL